MSRSPARPRSGADSNPRSGPPSLAEARTAFIRRVVTRLGIHRDCDLAVCRRAGACAGRHLPCYAARKDELRPILRSVIAHAWENAEAAGEADNMAPAARDDQRRILAAEHAAAARIAAGEEPDDDSAYGAWLRNVVLPHLRQTGRLGAHQDDGRAYDPDAKLLE